MRLKITIDTRNKIIPYEYHGFLQGVIYHALAENEGTFFHDEGFKTDNKVYKMFVFSELIGKYKIFPEGIQFIDTASFYVSCISSDFMNQLYTSFYQKGYIQLGKQAFDIINLESVKDVEYSHNSEYIIKTLSPITAYKTDNKGFTTYFHPKSEDFENSIKRNLEKKFITLFDHNENQYFEILDLIKFKEVKVKFKKSIYVAYICTMKIKASDDYLKLLLHVGLGSKNAAGFGMIEIV